MGMRQPTLEWDRMDTFHQVRLPGPAAIPPGAGAAPSGLDHALTPGLLDADAPPWSPHSPLFWAMGVVIVTLGAIAGSTVVRVGPFKAGVQAGNP